MKMRSIFSVLLLSALFVTIISLSGCLPRRPGLPPHPHHHGLPPHP